MIENYTLFISYLDGEYFELNSSLNEIAKIMQNRFVNTVFAATIKSFSLKNLTHNKAIKCSIGKPLNKEELKKLFDINYDINNHNTIVERTFKTTYNQIFVIHPDEVDIHKVVDTNLNQIFPASTINRSIQDNILDIFCNIRKTDKIK